MYEEFIGSLNLFHEIFGNKLEVVAFAVSKMSGGVYRSLLDVNLRLEMRFAKQKICSRSNIVL